LCFIPGIDHESGKAERTGLLNANVRSSYLRLLRDRIDPTAVAFSDRGSRILVYRESDRDRLYLKLGERLTDVQLGLETYRFRPSYIHDICFTDELGMPLAYHLVTYPHALFSHTRLGTFALTFYRHDTIVFGLPSGLRAGIRLHASTQIWQEEDGGGSFRAVRSNPSYVM
jgi:hypothetical protein